MTGIVVRVADGALIVLGAWCALRFSALPQPGVSGFDGSLVAFAVALALSVFPACERYRRPASPTFVNTMSRTVLAWIVVQACGFVLLYLLHQAHLVSRIWFAYWTIVSGCGLLIARTLALATLRVFWRLGKNAHKAALDGIVGVSGRAGALVGTARPLARIVKRTTDIGLAVPALVALLPFFVIIAVLVKLDGGPVFFGHRRVGRHGESFSCFKFRTMVINADVVLRQLLETNPEAREQWDRDFKLRDDVRITAVGRFLRKSSLDEIPQLWNVLRGEMSLVGPRPIVEKELPYYGHDIHYYLMAKPGITGLWQVSGRNDVDYSQRVSLDVSYVKKWSLAKDMAILARTVGVVLRREGAY